MRKLVVPAVLAALSFSSQTFAFTNTENFDNPPADWVGYLNEAEANFGYRITNYAGGVTAGEAGGRFYRDTAQRPYYADTTIGGSYSLDDTFSASGSFSIPVSGNPNNGAQLGFFDSAAATDPTLTPISTLGLHFVEQGGGADINVAPLVSAQGPYHWERSTFVVTPGSEVYDWEFSYDPDVGNGQLTGKVTTRSTGAEYNFVIDVSPEVRSASNTYDSFGLIGTQLPSDGQQYFDLYIDDVTYSVNEDVLFEDNFDDYSNNMNPYDPIGDWSGHWYWQVMDDPQNPGNNILTYDQGSAYTSPYPNMRVGDDSWTDYEASMDITWYGNNTSYYPFAMTVRDNGITAYRVYGYVPYGSNEVRLYMLRDHNGIVSSSTNPNVPSSCQSWHANYLQDDICHVNGPSYVNPTSYESTPIQPNVPFNLKMRVVGNEISVFVDDVQIGDTLVDYHNVAPNGRIGVKVSGTEYNSVTGQYEPNVSIDNVKVISASN